MGKRSAPLAIETRGLVKKYDELVAVDKVDLSVRRGEVFGLLGSNGAGKTTIIHMLTGILKPTSGTAVVAGHNLQDEPMAAKASIGYLPETPALYDRLTGYEYLQFIAGLRGMDQPDFMDRISRYLKVLDLEPHIHMRLGAYSKGMKQKISFTAAVFCEPDILFLDEPTSGLDPRYSQLVMDFIKDLSSRKRTVFISTHYTSLAETICHRVAIMHRGSITAKGTVTDLLRTTGTRDLAQAFIEVTGGPISYDLGV
jgi:ABC-2 type transport system ATP-binding protein